MNKVYIVYEYGGEYEDKWEHTIGVCSSLEIAQKLRDESLANMQVKTNISKEEYAEMLSYLYKYAEDHEDFIYESEAEGIIKLFPDKNPEDIEIIDRIYFDYDDFCGINIEEADFYD